ncbi:beta-lactamase family protein [Streptomyces sp. NBC_00201]|uniref:serine hydrolase domain-containing protein n=1 Tax=unclassified Streptomyces TaxID=2593676 RepID=UPI0022584493|nr:MULTISPECIES: serine hydrolase domain-containing protein [unclassified Streptomyces]MCX5047884.1 beta-lactamase family protein [Streptomyces sp. NBC_00474]MCX5057413.1 beta-lactamase family protein [Streptomyces sp. NBC_00452]MCX5245711.1 beta-lactamase family protein [Streptomyces sp. NBC_00201]MCX5288487.1 beta-lactamase family protein [Streptomyces sp. NBC_00183]
MSLQSLALIENWPVPTAAAGVVRGDGTVLGTHGPVDRRFRLASVTKPLAAYAALVAYEEGAIELDEPAGPPGSTVRHLLAHTSGLAFDEHRVTAPPGERRLYSNAGFEQLGDHIAKATEIPFPEYLRQAVLEPLGMTSTSLEGSPAKDGFSTVGDLLRFAAELQAPRLLDPRTVAEAMTVQYPGTKGVLPGYGHQNPNDWGLGFEIRDSKSPHWTGSSSSPRTFGHFGQSGTFLWIDPAAGVACAALTDRAFGAWAVEVWPVFTDAVLAEAR